MLPVTAFSKLKAIWRSGLYFRTDDCNRGQKVYELSNHLSNVLIAVTDRKVLVVNTAGNAIAHYTDDVRTATDYAPFGMELAGRKISSFISMINHKGFIMPNYEKRQKRISTESID